jgi:hypothetical protein
VSGTEHHSILTNPDLPTAYPQITMSAEQVKTHPAVQQLSTQASYYVAQLDKEVRITLWWLKIRVV